MDTDGGSAVSQAGGVLLTGTVSAAGLDVALRQALDPWCSPRATHHPAKVLLDLAVTLVLGGDACSDLGIVRAEPGVFGPVASDPASRTIARLAGDAGAVLAAIDTGSWPLGVDTLSPGLAWRKREDLLMARKLYTEEFRRDAVELYRTTATATVARIAADLGIMDSTLSTWIKAAGVAIRGQSRPASTAPPPGETPEQELVGSGRG